MDYHSDRFEDFSLVITKDSQLVALLPANIKDAVLYSHQGLTYGGLVLSKATKLSEVVSIFSKILQFLSDKGIETLEVKMLPQIYHKSPSDELDYILFKLKAEVVRCDVLSVVEPKNVELARDRMNGVKRGKKHELRVEEASDFDDFWNSILIPNLASKHKVNPVHTLGEIQGLKSHFQDQIRQFNVYHNDLIVAGTTIFETENVAHSQYISANTNKNTLGSLDFLHDHLLKRVFKDKKYFDFGISNENQGQNINEGLLYWKEGFGARAVAHRFYKIETKNYRLLDNLML